MALVANQLSSCAVVFLVVGFGFAERTIAETNTPVFPTQAIRFFSFDKDWLYLDALRAGKSTCR